MRVVKLNKLNTNILISVTATVLLLTHFGEAGAVSAAPDQYDPRRDPNYSREAFQTAPIHWEAIWALVREFEARAYPDVDRTQVAAPYAQPQPWHYVQGTSLFDSSSQGYGVPVYGDPYALARYAYYSSFSSSWGESPRIPWRSLIPFSSHYGHGHHHTGHQHDRRHERRDHQRHW
jgi:hypothetical protein